MRIGVIGSMQYTEQLLAAQAKLNSLGHEAFVTKFAPAFIGKSLEEKETIKLDQKAKFDVLREFWLQMQGADAVLAINLDKDGIANYIGGNAFLELGFAHILQQKIFLLNPIPNIPLYKTEIASMNPIIIHGDYSLIK